MADRAREATDAPRDRLEARREEILDASERIFAEKGYHETGIADIAAALGLGHGTFYRYFKNKHDIALKVFDRLMLRLGEIALAEDPRASMTLEAYREQSSRILASWLAFAEGHPHLLRFFHEQSAIVDASSRSRVVEAYVAQTSMFLRNGVDRGFLAADLEVRATAEIIVALILEGTRRVAGLPDEASRRRWAEAALRLIFDGVRSAATPLGHATVGPSQRAAASAPSRRGSRTTRG